MLDWFRLDAGPELATATAISYLHVYNKHLRPVAGHRPLEQFELPGPVTEVLGQMAAAGVGQATRDRARKVLSSAFGWGVETGRMRANGVRSLRRNRRRSRRLAAAEVQPVRRHDATQGVGGLAGSIYGAPPWGARSENVRPAALDAGPRCDGGGDAVRPWLASSGAFRSDVSAGES